MSRMYGKTTLLVTALVAGACVSLLGLAQATAQGVPCPDSPHGACLGGGCGLVGRLTDLHENDIQNCRARTYGQPELFYNYYVPGTCGGVPAVMYLAPRPVPAWVGYTYYTYQPVLPHEQLYPHKRTYFRYYDEGRGLTRTSVSWYREPFTALPAHLRLAR
jgi:hypothetical protein